MWCLDRRSQTLLNFQKSAASLQDLEWNIECSHITHYTVEPCLSNPRLSVPSIIRNDVHRFLKQLMLDC